MKRELKQVMRVLVYSGTPEAVDAHLAQRWVKTVQAGGDMRDDAGPVAIAELSLAELRTGTVVAVPLEAGEKKQTNQGPVQYVHEVPSVREWWKKAGR